VPTSAEDIDQYYQHYAWAQSLGVKWFSISLDDVTWGDKGPAAGGADHAKLVNTIFGRLRGNDPQAQMIFCPVPYWGDGTKPDDRAYLEALGKELHPDAYVFWTGDSVVAPRITRKAAESYKGVVKHRLFLWDNYPVNDSAPTMHLGPVVGRDPDLCEVIDGYMSNPLSPQNRINRLPLLTCADYAYNPKMYDPDRSIGQSIVHLAETDAQRNALKDLAFGEMQIGDYSFLAKLVHLQKLTLIKTGIKPSDFKFITGLPELRELTLKDQGKLASQDLDALERVLKKKHIRLVR